MTTLKAMVRKPRTDCTLCTLESYTIGNRVISKPRKLLMHITSLTMVNQQTPLLMNIVQCSSGNTVTG